MIDSVKCIAAAALALTVAVPAFANDLEANKELVRRQYEEVISKGNLDLLDEIVTEGFIQHDEGSGKENTIQPEASGREKIRQYIGRLREGIPDYRLDIEKIVAEGDIVSVFAVASGTHTGPLLGIPATGKPFTYATFDMFRIEDGKLAEHWDAVDKLGVMRRIGFIPLQSANSHE